VNTIYNTKIQYIQLQLSSHFLWGKKDDGNLNMTLDQASSGLLVDLSKQFEPHSTDDSVSTSHLQVIIDNLPQDLTDEQRQKAIQLIQVNHDAFSVNDYV